MPTEEAGVRHFEHVLHLRKVDLIGDLPAADLAYMAEYSQERYFSRGKLLLEEGTPVRSLHAVMAGRVHLSRGGSLVGHAGPGSGVGGLGVLARDEQGVDARAETDTVTLELEADSLAEILEDRFTIFHHILKGICARFIDKLLAAGAPAGEGPVGAHVPLRPPKRTLDLVERLVILRSAPPFANSSINSLAELSRSLGEVRYERGTTLWREGDSPSRTVLLLADGIVDCTSSGGYRQRVSAGQPVGNLEAMAERPRWYDAVSVTPVLALRARPSELLDIFEDNVRMGLDFLATMASGLLRQVELEDCGGGGTLGGFYGCDGELE